MLLCHSRTAGSDQYAHASQPTKLWYHFCNNKNVFHIFIEWLSNGKNKHIPTVWKKNVTGKLEINFHQPIKPIAYYIAVSTDISITIIIQLDPIWSYQISWKDVMPITEGHIWSEGRRRGLHLRWNRFVSHLWKCFGTSCWTWKHNLYMTWYQKSLQMSFS